jgi:hypothetical protein
MPPEATAPASQGRSPRARGGAGVVEQAGQQERGHFAGQQLRGGRARAEQQRRRERAGDGARRAEVLVFDAA